jgi:DNA-binding response OmpR family regulator
MKHRILLVEDDVDLGHLLKQYLEISHFMVYRTFDGVEARKELELNSYDILIIDVMMPNEDGFTLAEKLRIQYADLPFLFVTAKKTKEDIIKGLRLGADDYIVKPFDADELVLRVQNILKRSKKTPGFAEAASFQIGKYRFEPQNLLLIHTEGKTILTEKEAQLLLFLYTNRDRLIKREEILLTLWQKADFFNGRSLDVFITRIRKLLAHDKNIRIDSIRGVGFNFHC